ncbi:MAG: hypothetical protein M1824_002241 [Vezdaea acicularis]|nr:MAG: hypothetical protein M1824_002241 [Vezdaea acicularis]
MAGHSNGKDPPAPSKSAMVLDLLYPLADLFLDEALAMDPALVKYQMPDMFVNRHQYFRWTPRTAYLTFAYVVAFPAFIGYLAYTTDAKWDMRGKRRGDTIAEF